MTDGSTAPSKGESPEKKKERWAGTKFTALWVGFVAALLVVGCGLVLLWGVWDGNPVAAPFTRVGGETNVETAVDASHFWLTAPQVVVETSATASPSIMLGAAQCAMINDAPLLFTTKNQKRQQLVTAMMHGWNNPSLVGIQSQGDVTSCLHKATKADIADAERLSTLAGPYPFVQFPQAQPRIPSTQKLAPTVIFAAALQPGFLPDVAVGMALGAHMATVSNPVSLVIMPRYLEADPTLVSQLEDQHKLINGVVLGQTATVPDDTLALLRQMLTARDGHGVLAQIQDNLGSVAPVVAALLALIGLGVADQVAKPLIVQISTRIERRRKDKDEDKDTKNPPPDSRNPRVIGLIVGGWSTMANGISRSKNNGQVAPDAGGNWGAALGNDKKVIVWLRSGTKVSGVITEWHPAVVGRGKDRADALSHSILRLDGVTLTRKDGHSDPVDFVVVSVEDIELIAKPSPDQATPVASGTLAGS